MLTSTRHLLAERSGPLSQVLAQQFQLESSLVNTLIEMGAIYLNHVRTLHDTEVHRGDYLRAHLHPRRFPVQKINWLSHILEENADFLVIDKPHGIPTHASLDNCLENAQRAISDLLEIPLFITHRLDVGTRGLLVFAKNKNFQREFNRSLLIGEVEKEYQALVQGHFQQTGLIEHYMKPSDRAPHQMSTDFQDGWKLCRLEVLTTEPRPLKQQTLVKLKLLTGRTHQIRAQLSSLGYPVVGDLLYGSHLPWANESKSEHQQGLLLESFALVASCLRFPALGKRFEYQVESF